MNTRLGCGVFGALAAFAACAPTLSAPESGRTTVATVGGGGSGEEGGGGGGVSADVASEIDHEQQALADLDAKLAATAPDDDAYVSLTADRTARASYLADLQACASGAIACPPADEPAHPDSATIAQLATAACACRTRACVDWVLDAVNALGDQTDADGADAETAARECVHRRLGNDR